MSLLRRLALSRPVALIAEWHLQHQADELRQREEQVEADAAELSRFVGYSMSPGELDARRRLWAAQHEHDDTLPPNAESNHS